MKINRERLKRLLTGKEEIENMDEYIKNDITSEEIEMLIDVSLELRLDDFFEELNIDKDKMKKAKKRKIRLHPNSTKWPLMSTLYRNHKGRYKVEDLINEYHDSTLAEGMIIGIRYGKKFIVEDLQNKRLTREDIMNMSEDEIIEYCYKKRETI